ncbi:LysR family transcriptional regulator [Brucellaceae bacterium C25G]
MDLASLKVFRTVAKEQSITRAAELLGRVPSNVTTRIQLLEAEIGVQLFQRDKKRMVLTFEGQIYLDYADRILNLAEEAMQIVNPAEPAGVLRIGSMESTAAIRLPVPLSQFNVSWPMVTMELSTGPTRQLIEALLTHRIDCALIALPAEEELFNENDLNVLPLFREELVLLLPEGHCDVQKADDLKPRSIAVFASGCTYRMLGEKWLADLGVKSSQVKIQEVNSYHAMVACTSTGSCFCILPRAIADFVPEINRFTIQPLMTVVTSLASRSGFETPAFKEFRRIIQASSNIEDDEDAQ